MLQKKLCIRISPIAFYFSMFILVSACNQPASNTSRKEDANEQAEWYKIVLPKIDDKIGNDPCLQVEALGWLKGEVLVVAADGHMFGWNVEEGKPAWAIRNPPIGCSREDGNPDFYRLFTEGSIEGFLAVGWSQYRPKWKYLYYVIPGSVFREIVCKVGQETCLNGFIEEDNLSYTRWSPKNSMFAVSMKNSIDIYNDRGSLVHRLYGEDDGICGGTVGYRIFDWSPDGTRIVGKQCSIGTLTIWNVKSGKVEESVAMPGERFIGAGWGKIIYAATDSGRLLRYNSEMRIVGRHKYSQVDDGEAATDIVGNWYPIQVNTSGELYSISSLSRGIVAVFDWSGKEIATVDGFTARWKNDSRTLATLDEKGTVRLLDINEVIEYQQLKETELYGIAANSANLRWSYSGRYLAFICRHGVCVYDNIKELWQYPICRIADDYTIEARWEKEKMSKSKKTISKMGIGSEELKSFIEKNDG